MKERQKTDVPIKKKEGERERDKGDTVNGMGVCVRGCEIGKACVKVFLRVISLLVETETDGGAKDQRPLYLIAVAKQKKRELTNHLALSEHTLDPLRGRSVLYTFYGTTCAFVLVLIETNKG